MNGLDQLWADAAAYAAAVLRARAIWLTQAYDLTDAPFRHLLIVVVPATEAASALLGDPRAHADDSVLPAVACRLPGCALCAAPLSPMKDELTSGLCRRCLWGEP